MRPVLVGLLVLMFAESGVFAEQATIVIGSINPLTGRLAQHGIELDHGIQYAIQKANREGTINFKVAVRDDQSLPEVAMNQAEQLIDRSKVIALVGGYADTLVGAISVVAGKRKVPYVASASLESKLTEAQNPYFFRISHIKGVVEPIIDFLKEKIRPKKVALIYASTPGALELAHHLKDALKNAGVEVAVNEKVRPGTPDFSPFLLKCKNEKVDFVVSGLFLPEHIVLLKQMKQLRIPLEGYLAPWGIAYAGFIKEMKEAGDGLYGLAAWVPGATYPGTEKESEDFFEGYKTQFGTEPSTTSMHGYVSAKVIIEAAIKLVQSGKEITSENLVSAIRATDMVSPIGKVSFDKEGNPISYRQLIVQLQKGVLVPVFGHERERSGRDR